MLQKISTLWFLILIFALPTLVFAEGESFNPPGWAGSLMFFLALILPIGIGYWVIKRQNY